MTRLNPEDIPGFEQADTLLRHRDIRQLARRDLIALILAAATPHILAAGLADLADACEEDGFFGPELPLYLDAMSGQLRARSRS